MDFIYPQVFFFIIAPRFFFVNLILLRRNSDVEVLPFVDLFGAEAPSVKSLPVLYQQKGESRSALQQLGGSITNKYGPYKNDNNNDNN